MRHPIIPTLALIVALAGCGPKPDSAEMAHPGGPAVPVDASHSQATDGMMADLNTDLTIDPDIIDAWAGVRIRVVEMATGEEQFFEIPLGTADLLGDTGLVLTAQTYVPDFVMDERGITTRSGDTHNPAVRVIISEEGMADYEGWLFSKMSEIHPYPHQRYQVLLVEGIPAHPPGAQSSVSSDQ